MHIVAGREADITDSAASPEDAAGVYEKTASSIQRSTKLSAQTRDRIWPAAHMRNHVRNAMWTVLQYWSQLEQYADPVTGDHGYQQDTRGLCHFKIE
jgi:hypothetical protein